MSIPIVMEESTGRQIRVGSKKPKAAGQIGRLPASLI